MRALVLVVISLGLMILNHQMTYLDDIRSELSVLVIPVQYIVDKPMKFIRWAQNSFSTQQDVLEENARLRARQLLLQAKLQRLLALERENLQLRELMSSSSHFTGKVLAAQILDADLDPLSQEIILDKGSKDGVFVGQPVLDAYGVMGQVIEAGPLTSRVLLITDGRSAIPVQDNRNGMRAIIAGTGYANEISLLHMPATADVQQGDFFVTSGFGGRFPFGYPVGTVTSINKNSGQRFAVILAKPSAHVDKSRMVVLVWPVNVSNNMAMAAEPTPEPTLSPVEHPKKNIIKKRR